jgi:hypothetical protein
LGGLSVPESLAQLAGYYFDTAASTSVIQLTALKSFVGTDQIVTGTDCKWQCWYHPGMCTCSILALADPYVPVSQASSGLAATEGNGNFTMGDMDKINNLNALTTFPRIINALKLN